MPRRKRIKLLKPERLLRPIAPSKAVKTTPPKHRKPRKPIQTTVQKPHAKMPRATSVSRDDTRKPRLRYSHPKRKVLSPKALAKRKNRLERDLLQIQWEKAHRKEISDLYYELKEIRKNPEKYKQLQIIQDQLQSNAQLQRGLEYHRQREKVKADMREDMKRISAELKEARKKPKKRASKPKKPQPKQPIKTETGRVIDEIENEPDITGEDEEQLERIKQLKKDIETGEISEEEYNKNYYTQGAQIYQQIKAMIARAIAEGGYKEVHANWLNDSLEAEIRVYDFLTIVQSLAIAPEEELYYAQTAIDESSDVKAKEYIYSLIMLIQGNIPNTMTRKQIEENFGVTDMADFRNEDWVYEMQKQYMEY